MRGGVNILKMLRWDMAKKKKKKKKERGRLETTRLSNMSSNDTNALNVYGSKIIVSFQRRL